MTPDFLQINDTIEILSPSGAIDEVYIKGAKNVFKSWGLKVTEGRFCRSDYGRFSGTKDQRIADLQAAINSPDIKAILCSRGGYGLSQIIDKINFEPLLTSPKWFIGFSDITILHNALHGIGIASIHAIMAKHLTELPPNSMQTQTLKDMLFGKLPSYSIDFHEFNRKGCVTSKLIGGNLSVLMGMRATPYDINFENSILFIEDIGEKPYHIDRMIQNLRISGAFSKLAGLIVGQFSDCDEDPLLKQTVSELIYEAVKDFDYPVCFNFPAGHVDYNLPLIFGTETEFCVNENLVSLKF